MQGAQFTVSSDARVRTDSGMVKGAGLKDYVRDNPSGWVEFGTVAELETDEEWREGTEKQGLAWVRNLWIGCVVEVPDG